MRGFSAPAAGAPQTLGEGFTKGLDNITSPFRKAADFIRGGPDAAAQTASDSAIKTAQDYVTQPAVNDPTAQLALGDSPYNSFGQGPPRLTGEEYFKASPDTSGFSSQEFNKNLITNQAVDPTALNYTGQDFGIKAGVDPVTSKAFPQGRYPLSGVAPSSVTGPELGAPLNRIQPLSPANAPAVAPGAATSSAGPTMIDRAQSFYQDPSVKSFGNIFYDAPAKTTLGKLAPGLTTAGIAYLASGDPFKAPLPEGMTQEEFDAKIAQDQAQFSKIVLHSSVPSHGLNIIYRQPTARLKDLDPKAWKISLAKMARLTAQAREHPMTSPRCSPMASLFSRPSPFVTWAAEAVVKALPRCTS
jgi:hypothetical protein